MGGGSQMMGKGGKVQNCTLGTGWILSQPKIYLFVGEGRTSYLSLKLTKCDFPPLKAFPPHPVALLGLGYGFGTPPLG